MRTEHESLSAENEASFYFENIDVDEIQPKYESSVQKRSLPTPIREYINIQNTPTPAKGWTPLSFPQIRKVRNQDPCGYRAFDKDGTIVLLAPDSETQMSTRVSIRVGVAKTIALLDDVTCKRVMAEEQHVDQENSSTEGAYIQKKFEHEK